MILQLANDSHIKSRFFSILEEVSNYIDILEVGTPAILANGLSFVKEISKAFPEHKFLADTKIIDGGYIEASLAFESGADIITVLGLASTKTISLANKAAKELKGEIMIDSIGLQDIESFAKRIAHLSPEYLCIHNPSDLSSVGAKEYLGEYKNKIEIIRKLLPKTKIAVAGGISLKNLTFILPMNPDIVIVGRSICESENPGKVAYEIKKRLYQL
ncbi:MAG: orotidine 5'-phosphate decarboxylase / HUMPS family protein [Kosmotogaceae bacterium]